MRGSLRGATPGADQVLAPAVMAARDEVQGEHLRFLTRPALVSTRFARSDRAGELRPAKAGGFGPAGAEAGPHSARAGPVGGDGVLLSGAVG